MLKIENLTKRFGGLAAVSNVSVDFEAGKINAIIGPNGAGKSTFFNLVAGAMAPTEGRIQFQGMDITGMAC
ncbi:MAG: ATP-binding cassette domain-containing protein, partial [Alcanivorax sp.]|nr:ATP-binding cassette domain-containing protein [Alcanivorax sp.]